MRERLPWWKWLVNVACLPYSITAGIVLLLIKELPQILRELHDTRPWGRDQ